MAEGLEAGDAQPEEDEQIEFRLVKLSDVLKMIEKGAILDGKTLTSVLLYARLKGGREEVAASGADFFTEANEICLRSNRKRLPVFTLWNSRKFNQPFAGLSAS